MARKVASMTRSVPLATIDVVDRAVSAIIATESPSRVLAVAQAKIIEADPAAHAAKAEAERRRRYVALSQSDEHGLRHVIARVTAGDAVWVDALLERIADLIAPDHPDGTTRDELRSIAFGWLARPEELLALLQGRRESSGRAREARTQGRPPRASPRGRAARPDHRRGSRRGSRADVAGSAARPARPRPRHRQAGQGPRGPGAALLLRAPHRPQGAGPPDHRRRPVPLLRQRGPRCRLRPSRSVPAGRSTGSDRHPQLRASRPSTSSLEDPRRLHQPAVRRRPLRLADSARALLPGRPSRHAAARPGRTAR